MVLQIAVNEVNASGAELGYESRLGNFRVRTHKGKDLVT